jgi:acyl-coenzyme A synthetase/AMP-(fatty) acid ligase
VNDLPLIREYGAGAAFAYRNGYVLGVARFLQDVTQLAALLPDRPHILNLCADRYHFTVGFAAALLRRQISLLPPNHTPDLIERLRRRYPGLYCLTDAASAFQLLDTVFYPGSAGSIPAAPPVPAVPAAQTAAILFTSGSTGEPAAVPKSWRALVMSAKAEIDRLRPRTKPGMVILGTVPPQHLYGLESTVLMVMQGGLVLHAGRPFYTADILAELRALPQPRALVTTPVHLRALLAEPADFPPVDFLLCATARLSRRMAIEAEARFAAPLYEIYGCTEAGQIASRRSVESPEWHAYQGLMLRQNENGTWVKGGHVEQEVLLGDVIELLDGNAFFLHGRTADMVNIAGKRTSLAHLDYQLNSIEGVRDGVFIMPEDEGGRVTRLMAFVVAPGVTSETVTNALRLRIDAAFMPRPLCFVESLPRNTTGKLPRRALDRMVSDCAVTAG